MDAHDRAGDTDADAEAFGRRGDGTRHRPHERAVTLRANPRVEMIRDRLKMAEQIAKE